MQKRVKFRGREYIITLLDDGKLKVDDHIYSPIVIQETEKLYRVSLENFQFNLELIDGKLFLEGEEIDIEIKPYLKSVDSSSESQVVKKVIVRAPIPGKILQILVKEDEPVEKEQQILILEAMKMKNRILSPIKGIITKIYINIEDNVKQDQKLIKIEN
ncbi:MAG: acetyl-CoA carboxylase biotin carboxyl carrier protein subunit [Candidatus Heimdallarchaeota archaeon]|jgi:biotin carboxyl carrier protein